MLIIAVHACMHAVALGLRLPGALCVPKAPARAPISMITGMIHLKCNTSEEVCRVCMTLQDRFEAIHSCYTLTTASLRTRLIRNGREVDEG